MQYQYKHSTVSGTFDHFHTGHKKIIERAFKLAPKVSIGITAEKMVHTKLLSEQIESYNERKRTVKSYIENTYPGHSVSFFKLDTIEGIALEDKSLDSIVVTGETYKNASLINKKRVNLGMVPLEIIKIPFVKDKSGKIIRSTRIRQGEIDRQGLRYVREFFKKKTLYLPLSLRQVLREPLGKVIRGKEDEKEKTAQEVAKLIKEQNPPLIITVGDVVSDLLAKQELRIDLSIIDLHTQRGRVRYKVRGSGKSKDYKFINKPGTISSKVAKNTYRILKKGLKQKKNEIMIIRGEEDLIALPAILLAPLGTFIAYGQVDLGVVVIKVTEEIKKTVITILNQFE